MTNMEVSKADMVFEASWEVCNKVGGIYTVVKSKAELMKKNYHKYFLVGPYFPEKARLETTQIVPPERLKKVFDLLERIGIICYFGKWHIKGEPYVILINFQNIINQKNEIKKWLWESFQIDSINAYWDFEEPMIWSYAVGKLIQYANKEYYNEKIVGHFHEWLAGIALLYLKHSKSPVKTVFTTHATMLGRSLSGVGADLYSILDQIDPYKEAYQLNVQEKFLTERACAQNADIFTTVSEITSIEAEKILGRKADVLLLNGLDIQKYPNFEECSIRHRIYRDQIREFLACYFFPYYTFNLDDTILFFISGRYEYKNKGIDVFIKSLGLLNQKLKVQGSRKTIIAFFWIPSGINGIKSEILDSQEKYHKLKDFIDSDMPVFKNRIIHNVLFRNDFTKESIFDWKFLTETKKLMNAFSKQSSPPLSTHYLFNEHDDSINKSFIENNLLNKKEDKVKVINYPVYLDSFDNLLGLNYDEAIQGCHLGVFPSYYEPWGYTPLECAVCGVPAITTDLAGFGRFIETKMYGEKTTDQINSQDKNLDSQKGIFILKRYKQSELDIVNDLTNRLYLYSQLYKKDRVEQKMQAKKLSEFADWKELINNYIIAHNLALNK